MIDTLKIVTAIEKITYSKIKFESNIKTSYTPSTGEVFYKIITDSLEGLYGSSLSIRVGNSNKYKFHTDFYIEIEGSYHKMIKGYNSHNGFCNLLFVANELIKMVENKYALKLPKLNKWFIQRVDIAICFDLFNQENVIKYINNLSYCNYPKRKLKHYEDESIYLTGATTTLKIYNKLKEFRKHDISKMRNTDFDLNKYLQEINGFIRLECEIKKRKLQNKFNKRNIRLTLVNYEQLRKIWEEEFRKFFKLLESDLNLVNEKELVRQRLISIYGNIRGKNLYHFYLLIKLQGLQEIRKTTKKTMYYKNLSDLKKARIDFVQKLGIDFNDNTINFNPFTSEEIL